jgi:N-acetyl-anhydromuramyl-L-alanine amidase AmpD
MALKRGDTNPEVKKLQNALLSLGYPLPRWGADGNLGDETFSAYGMFAQDHSVTTTPDIISDAELAFLYSLPSQFDNGFALGAFFDRRASASLAGQKHDGGSRPWNRITGICLHQTACNLGENPPRWDTVGAHLGITRQGKVVWLHDFDRIIWHGNGWNAQTVGIEMDGLYAGVQGDATTVWDDPETPFREQAQTPTPELIHATQGACRWIFDEVAKHGGKVTALVAHRQSSTSRRNDPGSALWQGVALPLIRELGLSDGGPGFKLVDGYPIPEAWDPTRVGIRY